MTEEEIQDRSQLYTSYSVKDKDGKYRRVIDIDTVKILIDEQVKKALIKFLIWRDKRYGTPNPNPHLYDLDIYNFLNEKP